ncbi:MAG: hypothetical protein ACJ8FS_16930 [Sphingomicrobium sp.]
MPAWDEEVGRHVLAWTIWGKARNFPTGEPGFNINWKAQQGGVGREDVEILEAQQRSLAANADLQLRNLNIDAAGVLVRRMADRLIDSEGAI